MSINHNLSSKNSRTCKRWDSKNYAAERIFRTETLTLQDFKRGCKNDLKSAMDLPSDVLSRSVPQWKQEHGSFRDR